MTQTHDQLRLFPAGPTIRGPFRAPCTGTFRISAKDSDGRIWFYEVELNRDEVFGCYDATIERIK